MIIQICNHPNFVVFSFCNFKSFQISCTMRSILWFNKCICDYIRRFMYINTCYGFLILIKYFLVYFTLTIKNSSFLKNIIKNKKPFSKMPKSWNFLYWWNISYDFRNFCMKGKIRQIYDRLKFIGKN